MLLKILLQIQAALMTEGAIFHMVHVDRYFFSTAGFAILVKEDRVM